MKLKNPRITLQSAEPFQPGDLLKGSASWTLERVVKVKKIRLIFSGNCKVKWKTGSGDDEKTYKARETYFNHSMLLPINAGGQEVSLSPGEYRNPFQFQLPTNIPSSFSSSYGKIWYSITLQAEYSGAFALDDDYAVNFIVANPIMNHTQRQLILAREKLDGGCFGGGSTLKFEVVTNKSMYNSGEPVILNGYIMNGSNESLRKVKFEIHQNLTFFGKRTGFFGSSGRLKSKHKQYIIAEWKGEKVPPRGTLNLNSRVTVRIPDVAESDLKHCQFIDVKYFVIFKAVPSGFCSSAVSSDLMELTIGNQLRHATEEGPTVAPTAPGLSDVEPSPAHTIDSLDPAPPYNTTLGAGPAAPPSYSEAIGFSAIPPPKPEAAKTQSQAQTSTTQGGYYDWSQSAFTYT